MLLLILVVHATVRYDTAQFCEGAESTSDNWSSGWCQRKRIMEVMKWTVIVDDKITVKYISFLEIHNDNYTLPEKFNVD